MIAWVKKYVWGGIITVIALLALLLGIQTQRNKKLTSEANSAKKDAERAAEQLQRTNEVVADAERRRKQVLSTEATLDNIKKETAKAIEDAKKIDTSTESKKTFKLGGQWIILIAILILNSGCSASLSDCRAKYPCPDNVCVQVTPPTLPILPRPQSNEIEIDYDETVKGFILNQVQLNNIANTEKAYRITIEGYEKIINIYNKWRTQYDKTAKD